MGKLMRIILVEYTQNFPVLLGLMFALNAADWTTRLLWMGAGCGVTVLLIAQTEHLKLGKPVEQRLPDLAFNFVAFFVANILYVGYNVLIRSRMDVRLLADIAVGALLGCFVGIVQALFVDERRMTRQAAVHIGGLILAGIAVFVLVGALGTTAPPLLTAAGLCLLMTLIIVRIDYWTLVTA